MCIRDRCRIPLVVVIPLMGILLPKAVLDCVTEGGSLARLAAVLSVFIFILCVCHMVDKYITQDVYKRQEYLSGLQIQQL